MKVTIVETDGLEVTKIMVEDPRGLRTQDLRYTRFGWIFHMAVNGARQRVFEGADKRNGAEMVIPNQDGRVVIT